MTAIGTSLDRTPTSLVRIHLQFAWWSLLCFLSLGVALEALHAFKVGWYLEGDYETRRLMWTLGHAHGTLLAVVHGMFAATHYILPIEQAGWQRMASPCLMGASFLLPGGFILGGIFIYGGDPGIGIWLVPLGAVLLFTAVLLTAVGVVGSKDLGTKKVDPPRKKGKRG